MPKRRSSIGLFTLTFTDSESKISTYPKNIRIQHNYQTDMDIRQRTRGLHRMPYPTPPIQNSRFKILNSVNASYISDLKIPCWRSFRQSVSPNLIPLVHRLLSLTICDNPAQTPYNLTGVGLSIFLQNYFKSASHKLILKC